MTTAPITITVTATLNYEPSVAAATATFTIEILDPCPNAVLNGAATDMQAIVYAGVSTQALNTIASISGTTVTFCGAFTYTTLPSLLPSYLSLNQLTGELTLVSTDISEVTAAPITISVTAKLEDYL